MDIKISMVSQIPVYEQIKGQIREKMRDRLSYAKSVGISKDTVEVIVKEEEV